MQVDIGGKKVDIDERQYVAVPLWWLHTLSDADFKRVCLLRQRYDYFARLALSRDKGCDLKRVMWESQPELAPKLGFSKASRSRVGEFIVRMENLGIVEVIRETFVDRFGKTKPKFFLTVKDENLLESYGRETWN